MTVSVMRMQWSIINTFLCKYDFSVLYFQESWKRSAVPGYTHEQTNTDLLHYLWGYLSTVIFLLRLFLRRCEHWLGYRLVPKKIEMLFLLIVFGCPEARRRGVWNTSVCIWVSMGSCSFCHVIVVRNRWAHANMTHDDSQEGFPFKYFFSSKR